jgi:molecular chaperone Hsp33
MAYVILMAKLSYYFHLTVFFDYNKTQPFNERSMTEKDSLRRFIFENLGIRGEWVKLSNSWQTAKMHQQGPENAKLQLGQALAAVIMLSATIKFNGSIILQAQGDGDFKTLVAQSTHDQKIRGLIRCNDVLPEGSLKAMFGQGRLVITIEPDDAQPYQGIVGLEGKNLASALETYFEQSEQLNTRLWLFANETQAVGLLLQELPSKKTDDANWERIEILADTITEKELLTWDCEQLLFNLFNEDEIRIFAAEPIEFKCSCGRPKIERTLRALGKEELESIIKEQGKIIVGCEFCGEQYNFDNVDIITLLAEESLSLKSDTRH